MNLTDDQAIEAARRMVKGLGKSYADMCEGEQTAYRTLVVALAKDLGGEDSPAALRVFMLWMGDD